MANSKFSELPALTEAELAGVDIFPMVDTGSSQNKKITITELDKRWMRFGQVVVDEDNMLSNSDEKIPTQQSVKSYVDSKETSLSAAIAAKLTSPMTTQGDLIVGGVSGTAGRLAAGADKTYLGGSGAGVAPAYKAFQPPTIQKFLSGSGTYTLPAGVLYIQVEMAGGGGGGSGSGTGSSQGLGGAGGNSTFGSSLLVANGGGGGSSSGGATAGGTASLGTGPIGIAQSGTYGGGPSYAPAVGSQSLGGPGGQNPFGGGAPTAGAGGSAGAPGTGMANTGGGGSGAGAQNVANSWGGAGGGAGGYVKALIANPSSTYAYAVGGGGAGGTAGTSGYAGGAGGSGVIIVTEYYQ